MSNSLGYVYTVPENGEFDLGLPSLVDLGDISRESLARGLCNFYNGVVSLAVMRVIDGSRQILTGIRTDANETHPEVVSVATAVFAMDAIAKSLDEDTVVGTPDPHTVVFAGCERSFERTRTCYATNLGVLATHVLSIKHNLGDDVEEVIVGGAQFRYQNLRLGTSLIDHDPDRGEDVVEAIAMLNIGVTIPHKYSDLFTDSKALHSLTWVDESKFLSGFWSRRASEFFGNALGEKEVDVCVHGLCLETTALAIESS